MRGGRRTGLQVALHQVFAHVILDAPNSATGILRTPNGIFRGRSRNFFRMGAEADSKRLHAGAKRCRRDEFIHRAGAPQAETSFNFVILQAIEKKYVFGSS
jgi:hypothetical protein